ncbi:GIY-YIG nuclease family protein [Brevibacillus sp. MCWH]|uniref:GIY-YIG nuclease family protein n=1 Tax=Brevibacillus sp. MCWH TaxID=2508871 RepID=UPI001492A6F6|nr:GIY-YIG nuclease family protein [Brevibacillus sp. MCWH]NNV04631.1 hypothetical protein [Brevibacillus sp. MCWH]
MTMGVYLIRNKVNRKVYVGSSIRIEERWEDHIRELNGNRHNNRYLLHAWQKYGQENFSFEIIETTDDESSLIDLEQKWIDYYRSYERDKGYNLSPSAYNILGYRFTEEQRKRVSEALKGKRKSEEHRKKLWMNRKVTEEQRRFMSELGKRCKGRKIVGDHSRKKSEAQRGSKNPSAKYTEEQVIAIRRDLANHLPMHVIAEKHNVSYHFIYRILKNMSWTHVRLNEESERKIQQYNGRIATTGRSNPNAKLDEEKVRQIKQLLSEGVPQAKIAEMFNVGKSTIVSISTGKTWSHVV